MLSRFSILYFLTMATLFSCSQFEHKENSRQLSGFKSCDDITLEIINSSKNAEKEPSIVEAEEALGRSLSSLQVNAVKLAHDVGSGEIGKSGNAAGIFNYTFRQLIKKTRTLHEAGFSSKEIRILMEKKIVGAITHDQIIAAMTAEGMGPTMEVFIRESGELAQYTALDTPDLVGKKVLVKFIADAYEPGANVSPYSVPQMVLTRDYLDVSSQEMVDLIQSQSVGGNKPFEEFGGWVIYTDAGSYKSKTVTSNDPFMISNVPVLESLEQVLQQARNSEGYNIKIRDIEFYHTHWERGEAFAPGDLDFQKQYSSKIFKNLESGGSYSAYAIPVQGQVIFKSLVKKP